MTREFRTGNKHPDTSKQARRAGFHEGRAKARRKASLARVEVWSNLSPVGQLAALDDRLGKGIGAVKQRARLKAAIAALTAGGKAAAQVEQAANRAAANH